MYASMMPDCLMSDKEPPARSPALCLIAANELDTPLLDTLMLACFEPQYGEAWSSEQVASALSIPGTWARLAYQDLPEKTLPVGFVLARRILDEAEVLLIAVVPHQRQQGIGRQLLEDVIATARAQGATSLFLEVRESNTAALSVYTAHGFEIVGRRRGYYRGSDGKSSDAVTMRRALLNEVQSC